MKKLPSHGHCYVCGKDNPKGLGVQWYLNDDGSVFTNVELGLEQQGPPGHAHGGATASLLDEAMGSAVWMAGHMAVAAHLSVDFLRPLPLGETVHVIGEVTESSARKVFTRGEIRLGGGSIAAVATGVFVDARHLFPDLSETDKRRHIASGKWDES